MTLIAKGRTMTPEEEAAWVASMTAEERVIERVAVTFVDRVYASLSYTESMTTAQVVHALGLDPKADTERVKQCLNQMAREHDIEWGVPSDGSARFYRRRSR
jgi:hypothetical protein